MHTLRLSLALMGVALVTPGWAQDAAAAQMLARQSGCFKCHAIDKRKSGPSYSEVAAKYRGDPQAPARLLEHITSGKTVRFEDGHEEEHKTIQSSDSQAIGNLVAWLLSL
jgi:cytochrome c